MTSLLLRRLFGLVPVVVGVATLTFAMIHLVPGDPVTAMLGENAQAVDISAMRQELGLDQPLWQQYLAFFGGLASGDLGESFSMHEPVARIIAQHYPATAELDKDNKAGARPRSLTGSRVGRKLARMVDTQGPSIQISSPKSSSQPAPVDPSVAALQRAIANGDEYLFVARVMARRYSTDIEELRKLRLKSAGGSVFKRARSRYWQIKYLVDGKWRYESTGLDDRNEAERQHAFKVYKASEGHLPGTATFRQVIEHFLLNARSRDLRSVRRLGAQLRNC
jgi:hypothetical protein